MPRHRGRKVSSETDLVMRDAELVSENTPGFPSERFADHFRVKRQPEKSQSQVAGAFRYSPGRS